MNETGASPYRPPTDAGDRVEGIVVTAGVSTNVNVKISVVKEAVLPIRVIDYRHMGLE